jgi:hypothetical protein
MRGFTCVKDLDRKILLCVSDGEMLKLRNLNRYFRDSVCDDIFFRNRLEKVYPDVLKYKENDESWKDYFLKTIKHIILLQTKFGYKYLKGNLFDQYTIFKKGAKDTNVLLIRACWFGEIEIVKEAIKRGADIHCFSEEPLRAACKNSHFNIIRYLVERRADIHVFSDTILLEANIKGNFEIVKYLVEQGMDIHIQEEELLKASCRMGHLELVKFYVEHEASIHISNDYPLRWAVKRGNLSIVKYLIEQGASPHVHTREALKWAKERGHKEIVEFLSYF